MKTTGILIAGVMVSVLAIAAYAQSGPSASASGSAMHGQSGTQTMGGMMGGMNNGAMGGMQSGSMGGMTAMNRQGMSRGNGMMSGWQASDARLDQLFEKMKAARGNAKVEAMGNVIAELVSREQHMGQQMMSMGSQMMGYMMGQMTSGKMASRMASCPMWQNGGTPAGPMNGHAEHHQDTEH